MMILFQVFLVDGSGMVVPPHVDIEVKLRRVSVVGWVTITGELRRGYSRPISEGPNWSKNEITRREQNLLYLYS